MFRIQRLVNRLCQPKKLDFVKAQVRIWELEKTKAMLKARVDELERLEDAHLQTNGLLMDELSLIRPDREELDQIKLDLERLAKQNSKYIEEVKEIKQAINDFVFALGYGSTMVASFEVFKGPNYLFSFYPRIKRQPDDDPFKSAYGYAKHDSRGDRVIPAEQQVLVQLVKQFGLNGWTVKSEGGSALQLQRSYDKFPWDDLKTDQDEAEARLTELLYDYERQEKFGAVTHLSSQKQGKGEEKDA